MLPDVTVVGQKDTYYNFAIKSLIKQLGLSIKVIIAPTIRDSNGVALSSRNAALNKEELINVSSVYKALQEVSTWSKIEPINYLKLYITHQVKSEYCNVDVCCVESLKDLIVFVRDAIIIINALFGEHDLGDNIIIKPK